MKWETPPEDYIKVNFDGSVKGKKTVVGFTLRNHTGKLIKAGTTYLGEASILAAEATTLRNGVRKAIEIGYKKTYHRRG